METRPYIPWELINNFMIDVFKAYGVPEADAKICADVLLEALSYRKDFQAPRIRYGLSQGYQGLLYAYE